MKATGKSASVRATGKGASVRATGKRGSVKATGKRASVRATGKSASVKAKAVATKSKRTRKVASAKDDFLGGARLPNQDRRFLLKAGVVMLAGMTAGGALFALGQKRPAAANWGQRAVPLEGYLVKSPYPYLMIPNNYFAIGYDTVFLVQEGRFGAMGMVRGLAEGAIRVRGKRLNRADTISNYLVEIVEATASEAAIAAPGIPRRRLGTYRIRGRLVDSKSHFGMIKPAVGRTHKATSALCVRGGIPPIFVPQDTELNRVVLALAGDGLAAASVPGLGADVGVGGSGNSIPDVSKILPYMQDLIEAEGELTTVNNHYEFTINNIKVLA